jgi:hypothetical protein
VIRDLLRGLFSREENAYFNVTAVVRNQETGLYRIHRARNIITDSGDLHLAQKAAGEAPTIAGYTPGSLYLFSAFTTPDKTSVYNEGTLIASTEKTNEATYPKTNDSDTDNTGKATDSITRKYLYSAASFNHAAITDGAITVAGAAGAQALYAVWTFAASINKTAADTLTVYHNTNFLGV